MLNIFKNKKTNNKGDNQEVSQTAVKDIKSEKLENNKTQEGTAIAENSKISFDDFLKVEITIGEIISAEKVENADRLLKLKVDFGHEQRQIVSGIAEFYTPEELPGKKCPFVTNLEPRTIRGEESNGMILAAKDKSGNFSILGVDQKIKKGTKIS